MQTQTANYWSGLRDSVTSLGIDLIRARHIDAQDFDDEKNVPDESDIKAGFGRSTSLQSAPGGIAVSTWLTFAALGAVGYVALKKFV